jgi:hypothetical protein
MADDDETPPPFQFWLTSPKWSSEYTGRDFREVYDHIKVKLGIWLWSHNTGLKNDEYWQSAPTIVLLEWDLPHVNVQIEWFIKTLHGPILFLAVPKWTKGKMENIDKKGRALTNVKDYVLPLLENPDDVRFSDLDYEILVIDFEEDVKGRGMQPLARAKHYHHEAPEGEIVDSFKPPIQNWIRRFEDPSRAIKSANKIDVGASGPFRNTVHNIKKALVENEGDIVKAAASLMKGESL